MWPSVIEWPKVVKIQEVHFQIVLTQPYIVAIVLSIIIITIRLPAVIIHDFPTNSLRCTWSFLNAMQALIARHNLTYDYLLRNWSY